MQIFISAERHDVPTTVNNENHINLGFVLRTAYGRERVTEVVGAYAGTRERSYRVTTTTTKDIGKLAHLAFLYRQESILVVYHDGEAVLWYCDARDIVALLERKQSHTEVLGKLVEVDSWDSVNDQDGWSYVDGKYYRVQS